MRGKYGTENWIQIGPKDSAFVNNLLHALDDFSCNSENPCFPDCAEGSSHTVGIALHKWFNTLSAGYSPRKAMNRTEEPDYETLVRYGKIAKQVVSRQWPDGKPLNAEQVRELRLNLLGIKEPEDINPRHIIRVLAEELAKK